MFRWHDLLHPLHSYQSHICIFLWTLPWNVTNLSQLLTVLLHRTLTSYPFTHTSTHTCDPMWSVLTFFVIDCCSPFNSFVACLSHWAQLFLLFSITSAHEHFQSKNLIIYKFADVITFFLVSVARRWIGRYEWGAMHWSIQSVREWRWVVWSQRKWLQIIGSFCVDDSVGLFGEAQLALCSCICSCSNRCIYSNTFTSTMKTWFRERKPCYASTMDNPVSNLTYKRVPIDEYSPWFFARARKKAGTSQQQLKKKCSRHSFYRMKSTEQIEFIRKLLIQNLFECKGRARARKKEQIPTSTQQLNSCI